MKERLSIAEMMRNGWLYYSDGYRTKKPELGPTGFPIMRVAQVLDGYLGPASNPEFVRDEYKKKIGQKSSINGDVILTTKGTVGRMARIWAKDEGYVYSPQVCFFRVLDESRIDRAYLYYAMAGEDFRQQMQAVSTQTDMAPYINLKDLGRLEIDVPEFAEQRSIASILGALDDKIELNRRMNATLEALAQAVFKEWFVEKPEEAWEEVPFARTVKVFAGGTPKTSIKEYWNGDIPWFAIADAGPTDVFVVDTERKVTQAGIDNSSAQIVPKGTTIFTARGTVGQTVLTGVPMAMNQSCFGLWGVHDRYGYYTYFRARQLAEQFQQYSHGSVFSTINRSTFETLETRLPDKDTIARFEDFVKPMMERILVNISESRNLAALRDTLLPKLMRGEVRVSLELKTE